MCYMEVWKARMLPCVNFTQSFEMMLFSGPPLDGTVSFHYVAAAAAAAAAAEEGLLSIQQLYPHGTMQSNFKPFVFS